MMMFALIDADSIIYRGAYKFEPKEGMDDISLLHGLAMEWTHEFIGEILTAVSADGYMICLGGMNNFRKIIFPEYKAGRKPRPLFYNAIRNCIIDNYTHFLSHGAEAEDAVYSYWNRYRDDYDIVVCGIDKDLKQFPCNFYNYNKKTLEEITEEQALYNKWMFTITGDATDNVKTLKGFGEKKAKKILANCKTNEDYELAVLSLYSQEYGIAEAKYRLYFTKLLTDLHFINIKPIEELI